MSELQEWRGRAHEVLSPGAWDYVETGAGAEVSLGEAESAWQHWRFRPRVLRDVSTVSTATTVLGAPLDTPVLVAPSALHSVYHPEAEVGTARGAAAAGSLMVVSTRSTRRVEDVAETGVPWMLQTYVTRDRRISDGLARRAAASGALALMLTGDTPYVSRRTRSGRALSLDDAVAQTNVAEHLDGVAPGGLEGDASITVAEIDRLATVSGLPVLVKGVLRGDDADVCLDAGAAGIVVSNHGARQLDRAVPTARALPEVVAAVDGRAPVLVDGGIRSGADVLTALALGADAVMLGRPAIHALAVDGADGVAAMLTGITDDLGHAMGLAGASSLADIDASLVTPA